MKTRLIVPILLTVIGLNQVYAQDLIVNAGDDTTICYSNNQFDPLQLGGNPTASFGQEPYIYDWTGVVWMQNSFVNVSYLLNDTTISNPLLVNCGYSEIIFYVKVTDGSGIFKIDTINVNVMEFIGDLGMNWTYLQQGDTFQIYPLIGGEYPIEYYWNPNYNISNQIIGAPFVWPDSTTIYYCSIVDSVGCIDTVDFTVYVTLSGLDEHRIDNEFFEVYPNPITDLATITIDKQLKLEECEIKILNLHGKLIYSYTPKLSTTTIDASKFSQGVNFIELIYKDQKKYCSKIYVSH